MACNVMGGEAAPSFVSAAAGDTVSFEWYHDNRGDDIIASSHKGPIQVYIAPYDASPSQNGTGSVWTKIASQGYDASAKTWAVDDLIANKGKHDFKIPSSLAAGQYLIRGEIIALHEADTAYTSNPARGAQFYPSCVQFKVSGSGSATPPDTFDINTGYTESDPGIVFNLYGSFSSYQAPGPQVWDGTGSGNSTPPSSNSTSSAGSSASTPPTVSTTLATSVIPTSSAASAPASSGSSDDDTTCGA
ncbi:MAG: hypothetical protein Q9227_009413 [Pyrenula ochraceoflavens]